MNNSARRLNFPIPVIAITGILSIGISFLFYLGFPLIYYFVLTQPNIGNYGSFTGSPWFTSAFSLSGWIFLFAYPALIVTFIGNELRRTAKDGNVAVIWIMILIVFTGLAFFPYWLMRVLRYRRQA